VRVSVGQAMTDLSIGEDFEFSDDEIDEMVDGPA
jgi:hypothetical protein